MQNCKKCRFCSINTGKYLHGTVDTPIISNEDFFVIPSIGAIIEGWTLVIPRNHTYSMRNYYTNKNLCDITNKTITALQKNYGQIIAFEHGADGDNSPTSCGTDHAHIHLVPFNGSFSDAIGEEKFTWIPCRLDEIPHITQRYEYLFYTEINPSMDWNKQTGKIHILEAPTSQYFRRIIAKHHGLEEQYDYKSHPFIENATNTSLQMAKLL